VRGPHGALWTRLPDAISVPPWFSLPTTSRRGPPLVSGVSGMTQSTRRRRVLIVEDEPALRLSYERAFRPRYDLVFASTGAEALEQLELQRPDVAVLDMRLPDTDGVELLRRIRLSQPELPVIITTAYMSIEPQLKVLDLPHSGYIVKPFRLDELGARIDAVL
jgi:two-component system, OmpR family, response regulator